MKTEPLNLPILPAEVEGVRALLVECGVSKWRETEVGPARVDLAMKVTLEQQQKIFERISVDVFALIGLAL